MLQNNASEADLEIFTHRKSLSQAGGLASVFDPGSVQASRRTGSRQAGGISGGFVYPGSGP